MKVDEELAQATPDRNSVITIGVFDGVHRGHRQLISPVVCEAKASGRLAGVVTFWNHPASVLRPNFKPQYLTEINERIRLITALGVDFVVPVTFDSDLSSLDARDFIGLLQKHLRMSALIIGPDFAMGHNRDGDAKRLTSLGEDMGFTVDTVDSFIYKGEDIRSTVIRKVLSEGDVEKVAKMLGRNFLLKGVVTRGIGRGKDLGFPTANLEVDPEMAIPGNGIYATRVCWGEGWHMAASSIGIRPTFDETERTIEVFILEFEGDLYGQELHLEFVQRLRDEVKYDTIDPLQEQIRKDVSQVRKVLTHSPIVLESGS